MRIVVHRQIPDLLEFGRQWNSLAFQTERPQVFYTWEWALAMQTAYRNLLMPLLFLGYEQEKLVGVASLATGHDERDIGFLAASTADYCDFLSAPNKRAEFVELVLAELQEKHDRTSTIALANLPAESETLHALKNLGSKLGFHVYPRRGYLCAQVELRNGEARENLKTSLAGKKKLRRYLREMEREGAVEFIHLQSWERIQAALPAFFEAHVARFVATGRVSSLASYERRQFLQELAKRFDGGRVVTLSILSVAGRPVAWNYGFQFCGSWFWYQPTFTAEQEQNSPGYCLLSTIVLDACEMDGMQVVDLGLGAEGYKERFGNSARETLYVTVTKSWARHMREKLRYQAAGALKQSPKMELAVRRVLSQIRPGADVTPRTR